MGSRGITMGRTGGRRPWRWRLRGGGGGRGFLCNETFLLSSTSLFGGGEGVCGGGGCGLRGVVLLWEERGVLRVLV